MIKLAYTYTFTLLAGILLASGCSSNKNAQLINPNFLTRISDSGLKHFQIQAQRAGKKDEQRSRRQRANNNGGDSRPSARSQNKLFKNIQKQLYQSAELKIEETQYCRSGFWVLNTEADATRPFLRGECNEKATKADRAQFPTTLLRW